MTRPKIKRGFEYQHPSEGIVLVISNHPEDGAYIIVEKRNVPDDSGPQFFGTVAEDLTEIDTEHNRKATEVQLWTTDQVAAACKAFGMPVLIAEGFVKALKMGLKPSNDPYQRSFTRHTLLPTPLPAVASELAADRIDTMHKNVVNTLAEIKDEYLEGNRNRPEGYVPCCDNEKRSFAGGCENCGDPCL